MKKQKIADNKAAEAPPPKPDRALEEAANLAFTKKEFLEINAPKILWSVSFDSKRGYRVSVALDQFSDLAYVPVRESLSMADRGAFFEHLATGLQAAILARKARKYGIDL